MSRRTAPGAVWSTVTSRLICLGPNVKSTRADCSTDNRTTTSRRESYTLSSSPPKERSGSGFVVTTALCCQPRVV